MSSKTVSSHRRLLCALLLSSFLTTAWERLTSPLAWLWALDTCASPAEPADDTPPPPPPPPAPGATSDGRSTIDPLG